MLSTVSYLPRKFAISNEVSFYIAKCNIVPPFQRHQSGLKSGGRGSGSTKFLFFQANFREILIFSGNFMKKFDFSRPIFGKF